MLHNNQDLHQFSSYLPPIDLTFHQYLLATNEPLLIHTGNLQESTALIPKLRAILNGKKLKYVFVSHFESDECGGLSVILEEFPEAKTICSEVTARQLSGFGLARDFVIKKPGEKLTTDTYELEFFGYPSEMHLWEGLLMIENKRKIFFSSDLMIRFGGASGTVIESQWQTEIDNIKVEQVPNPQQLTQLQQTLAQLRPNFVATGHGPCLELK